MGFANRFEFEPQSGHFLFFVDLCEFLIFSEPQIVFYTIGIISMLYN